MYTNTSWHFGHWLFIIIPVVALLFAFEVWMVVDAALNKKLEDKPKAWWIVGMLVVHPIVAIAYFFTDRNKQRK